MRNDKLRGNERLDAMIDGVGMRDRANALSMGREGFAVGEKYFDRG